VDIRSGNPVDANRLGQSPGATIGIQSGESFEDHALHDPDLPRQTGHDDDAQIVAEQFDSGSGLYRHDCAAVPAF
jgi:hypothetical protein